MDSSPRGCPTGEHAPSHCRVTLRYWAAARAAAGQVEEHFEATTVGAVLEQARRAHSDNPRFAQVLDVSSLLVADQPIGMADPATVPLADGDVVEVLPPFAGG
jgi:molybdopterin synthase sulfur carrier subunit